MGENRNFLLLGISFALPFGAFLAIGALMSNLFDPFGLAPSEMSTVALLMLGSGIIGAVCTGAFIDKTGLYKSTMHFITFMTMFATISVIFALSYYLDNESMFLGFMELLGFFSTGFVPLALSYGAELTFPLQPALVNGTLTLLGSISSFVLGLMATYMNTEGREDHLLSPEELIIVKRKRSKAVMSALAVTAGIAFILSFFIKEDLKRLRYQEKQENKKKNKPLKKIREGVTDAEDGAGAYRSDENGTSSSGSYKAREETQ